MLDHLPTELRLKTLAYLDVRDLRNIQLTSRSWQEFFLSNGSSIYRHAAALHGFVYSSEMTLREAKLAYPASTVGVQSWKALVQQGFNIERNWQGQSQPTMRDFWSSGTNVHRIKIDEEVGLIITTSSVGGVIVTDLYQDYVLWSLPPEYVRASAHCEYGRGYMIFDRIGGAKEVWRRACDFEDAALPTECMLDDLQLMAAADAAEIYGSTDPRGHFKPWALIHLPEVGSAFRFVYPTLLVATPRQAFLWDIPTARHVTTISDIQMPIDGQFLGRVTYVEVSERYVVICGILQLRIFNRPQGTLVYHIPAQRKFTNWALDLADPEGLDSNENRVLLPVGTFPRTNSSEVLSHHWGADSFMAAHISPCGSILVALLDFGRALIVGNLDRVINGEVSLADSTLDINLKQGRSASSLFRHPSYSMYLALGNGKIGCATHGGIYVITIDSHAHGVVANNAKDSDGALQGAPSTTYSPFPRIVVCRGLCFDDTIPLATVSCLQITDTALFIAYKPCRPLLAASDALDNDSDRGMFTSTQSTHSDDNGIGHTVLLTAGPSTLVEEQDGNPSGLQNESESDSSDNDYDGDDDDDSLLDFHNGTIVASINFVPV